MAAEIQLQSFAQRMSDGQSFEKITARLRRAVKREAVQLLLAAADSRENSASRHARTVQRVSRVIARRIGLGEDEVNVITGAAIVHDIGKIAIPERILNKPAALTDAEFDIMKRHPVIGAEILATSSAFDEELPRVRHHHERVDGRGYPDGLFGEGIPIGARILAVADALDVMLSPRLYKNAFTMDRAVHELRIGRDRQFDGRVVDATLQWLQDDDANEFANIVRRQDSPRSSASVQNRSAN